MENRTWRIGFMAVFAVLAILTITIIQGDGEEDSTTLRILSGSENQALEPLISAFADEQDVEIDLVYAGSIDIMRELHQGAASSYDAVWPSNRMWLTLGDSTGVVLHAASISRSPVVLGVKQSVAEQLGWIGAPVTVADVLAASEAGQLRFIMANAAQSDAGASAYLGFLYAFAGQPDMLNSDHLDSPGVREQMKRILSQVNRTSGSSGFLSELLINEYDAYDAMFNYESELIETNQTLVAAGQEPLHVIYLVDGTAIADSPLALIDKGDDTKEELFRSLQAHLLSDSVQRELLGFGRRAGITINLDPASIDQAVFNPSWGIDTLKILTPIRIPTAETVLEALGLYQTAFRRPSFTVMLLDYSGSMSGNDGAKQMKAGMRMLLDQEVASQYLLQASPDDVTVVIAFSDRILGEWTVVGNDPAQLLQLADTIDKRQTGGGTAIYDAVHRGLEILHQQGYGDAVPSIVLLTDGESNEGRGFDAMRASIAANGWTVVPVYGIRFGSASREQLDRLAEYSSGAVFDGRSDLAGAFRIVLGYT